MKLIVNWYGGIDWYGVSTVTGVSTGTEVSNKNIYSVHVQVKQNNPSVVKRRRGTNKNT